MRSDNGLASTSLHRFHTTNGILHQILCNTPQQNGRIERKHQHIARALHFQANLQIDFLGECFTIAAYLTNRTLTSVLQNKSPYEHLFGKDPKFSIIRMFACLFYANNRPHIKTNLDLAHVSAYLLVTNLVKRDGS